MQSSYELPIKKQQYIKRVQNTKQKPQFRLVTKQGQDKFGVHSQSFWITMKIVVSPVNGSEE